MGRQGRGMSRGRSHGRGRGSKTAFNKSKKDETNRDVTIAKFAVGTAKQASEYTKIKKYCINQFRMKYKQGFYIASALEDGYDYDFKSEKPDALVLTKVEGTDDEKLVIQGINKSKEIDYRMGMEEYHEKLRTYTENKYKAYAFLWDKCTSQMKQNLEAKSEYLTKIKNDPFNLLKHVESLSYNYQESKYEMGIILDSIRTFINLKQKDDENLTNYLERFKAATENMKTQLGGELILTKYVESMDDYTKSNEIQCIKKAFEELKAYTFIANSDQNKYGTLVKNLAQQQALKNTQYPKTLTAASEVLMEHQWDQKYFDSKQKRREQQRNRSNNESNETNKEELELSFAQLENACYCCGKKGHSSNKCYKKDTIPREQWYINKLQKQETQKIQQHLQVQNNDNESTVSSNINSQSDVVTTTNSITEWGGAHITLTNTDITDLKNTILLDNGSSTSIFTNPNMVRDITTVDTPLELMTNGGELITYQQATVPGFGRVWYDDRSIANIFGFAELKDKYRITYDSEIEDAFIVHLSTQPIKFTRTANGLYTYTPSESYFRQTTLVQTVQENQQFYTNRQIQRAQLARQLYHNIGTPSLRDFKAVIRMNAISNCPITLEDIKIAEQIYGKDIASLKGKTTRTKPLPVIKDYIDIPKELIERHEEIVLAIDIMYIYQIPFLTTISNNIMYRTAQPLPNKTSKAYRSALDHIFRLYNHAGFKITTIKADQEFKPILDEIKDTLDITMHYASAQEHVPEAERNNRTIKERFRSQLHRLPFKIIPRIMIQILVMEVTKKLNYFPPKGGVSTYYSPRMILHQSNLNYNTHFKFEFGQFVQATDDNPITKNTPQSRTIDCIYLRNTPTQQGGHQLLDLTTRRLITRHALTTVPITHLVISRVEQLAKRDGFRVPNRSLLAGVDNNDDSHANAYKTETKTENGIEQDTTIDDETNNKHENTTDKNSNTDRNEDTEDETSTVTSKKDDTTNNHDYANQDFDSESEMDDDDLSTEETEENDKRNKKKYNYDLNEDQEEIEEEEVEEEVIIFEDDNQPLFEDYNMDVPELRRTTRNTEIPKYYKPSFQGQKYQHLHVQTQTQIQQYDDTKAYIGALSIHRINQMSKKIGETGLAQTYSLQKGLKVFGEKGSKAAYKEMKQLHDRICFRPINPSKMTTNERKKAMESLIFLTEKRDGTIKARTCANGSVQRDWMTKEESTSPTTTLESVIITAVVDAKENRDVATVDIPNAFIQTELAKKEEDDRVILKIRGKLVDMLVDIDPGTYAKFVAFENGKKILYCEVLKAIYGMLMSALMFYKKWRKDLIRKGYTINPYDPCVANKIIRGKQHTVTWHVDDLKSSHIDKTVNDEFIKWVDALYGDDEIGRVKAVRGKKHDHLGMILDYSEKGKVKIDMRYYVKNMINQFNHQLTKKYNSPASEKLFKINPKSPKLDKDKAEHFHTTVARGLFVAKRARPDIQTTIAYLCTRVKQPTEDDWQKLIRLMSYLYHTIDEVLTLSTDGTNKVRWWIDAAFAVHPDMRSHTGAVMSMGNGAIQSISKKQKVNTRSSTEAELVATDDILAQVIWTQKFMQAQGIPINNSIIYQDNKSAILLETNGKASAGKRSRHLDIRYFFITDHVNRGDIEIKYCPTEHMVADYYTKPLHGAKFQKFKQEIMNLHV